MVDCHVACYAAAEVPPVSPCVGGVFDIVGAHLAGADPHFPVEAGGDFHCLVGAACVVDVAFCAGPGFDLLYCSDRAVGEPFAHHGVAYGGAALVAHLGGDFCFGGDFGYLAGFPDVVGEWFFAVDAFAVFHCRYGDVGVPVVGGCAEDGVEIVFFLVEEGSEIAVSGAFVGWVGFLVVLFEQVLDGGAACEAFVVESVVIGGFCRVGYGGDLDVFVAQETADVVSALSAASYYSDVEFFAGGCAGGASEDVPGDDGERGGCG